MPSTQRRLPCSPGRAATSMMRAAIGNLMGGLMGGNIWLEGLFAHLTYLSLYKLHENVLHGPSKMALDTLARLITRRTEPHVKLH